MSAVLQGHAQTLYEQIKALPIVSPHGHTDPGWFADDLPFADPASLLIVPDHYVFRLLYSRGVPLDALGVGVPAEQRDSQAIFRVLARHWDVFLGTPSRGWLEATLRDVFGIEEALHESNADAIHASIAQSLTQAQFRPRALLTRFGIDVLATTDAALDSLDAHAQFRQSEHRTRLLPTFRPDGVLDPQRTDFIADVHRMGELTGEDIATTAGFRAALAARRAYFIAHGATASDHDVPHLATERLSTMEAQRMLDAALRGTLPAEQALRFYNHQLIEMAELSLDDGLVMQLHVGVMRSTNEQVLQRFGPDTGADIPRRTDWVGGLQALLQRVGNDARAGIIAFTLDESSYARELAPMAGHWPALMLGPPWWFHDSPNGIARYFDAVVESAGYANLAGFNDDTRALMSIPARHDMWRRAVAQHLAAQLRAGRFSLQDAGILAERLAGDAARNAYRLESDDA